MDDAEALAVANRNRREMLCDCFRADPPDHLILWSGNFHYQEGTLAAMGHCGLKEKTLFAEVAWFPQKEYLYLDPRGTNFRSTIAKDVRESSKRRALTPQQKAVLDLWRDRFIASRLGGEALTPVPKRIFVPLQVDTDSSIALGSPFDSMAEFIAFMEQWVPEDWEVVFKSHPKAMYDYVPSSNRENFRHNGQKRCWTYV